MCVFTILISCTTQDFSTFESNIDKNIIMSLLGFKTYLEYSNWITNHNELNNVFVYIEVGDIVRLTYNNENGYKSFFDWMIIEYQNGYTFYSIENRSRVLDSDMIGFANTLTNFVTGAAIYKKNIEDDYVPKIGTSGFNFGYPMILPENWNYPVDGGVIIFILRSTFEIVPRYKHHPYGY